MKNVFGLEMLEIKDLIKDPEVEKAIKEMLSQVFSHLETPKKKVDYMVERCISLAKDYNSLDEYEEKAHLFLEKENMLEKIKEKFDLRSHMVYNHVKNLLIEGNVLDFGCGNGIVGEELSKDGKDVTLTDVYKHPHIEETGLKFEKLNQKEDAPFENNEFDNVLALMVYHHTDDPLHSIKETKRITRNKGRIIVIESVYGVRGQGLNEEEKSKIKEFLSLTDEQQRRVAIFFDHFYNRIIDFKENKEDLVNVPFNFNTPEKWKEIFEKHGLKQEKMVHLGYDLPIVPEYHTLHILRVEK